MATKGEDVVEIISKLNSLVVLTYHNNDAIMRPTAMQSTNTTHNKNTNDRGLVAKVTGPVF